MRIPRWGLIGAGLLPLVALFGLLVWGIARDDSNPGGLSVFDSSGEARIIREIAPDFDLTLFDGSHLASDALRGQFVMVDFWASWCVPCKVEAKTLEAVWKKYQDRGIVFVGVDIWDKQDRAAEFLEKTGTTYPVGIDPRGEMAVTYGVTGIPEKYFIDPEGRVLRKMVGPMSESRLTAILDELFARAGLNPVPTAPWRTGSRGLAGRVP